MLDKMYDMVLEFTKAYDFQVGDENTVITDFLRKQRLDLIHEEICEYEDAKKKGDRLEMLDALCDIMYVVLGSHITFGIPLKMSNKETELCDFTDELTHSDKAAMALYLTSISSNVLYKSVLLNVEFKKAFTEVHRSNMSKSCGSIDEVYATMAQHKYKDIDYNYVTKEGRWFIHRKDNGKLIKSIAYSKAELAKYI